MRLVALIKSARFRALLSLGMVLGLGAVGTLAAWSTTTTTTSGLFTTGTVDIKLNSNDGPVGTPYPVSFATPLNLLPGHSIAAMLPIQNTGTLGFNYTVAARGIDALGQGLQITVRATSAVSGNACVAAGSTLVGAANTQLTASDVVLGSRGPLGATSGTESLCFQFTLPVSAPNSLQSATGNVRLTFSATSV